MATAKKTVAKKPARVADKELTPISEITLGSKKRDKTGPKQKLYNLVPKRGHIAFRALLTAAEKEGLPPVKVRKWLPAWAKKGYIAID
jgi:hypothetical protein